VLTIFDAEECYVVRDERMETVDGNKFFCETVWHVVVIDA
jgi:hypothetical protein